MDQRYLIYLDNIRSKAQIITFINLTYYINYKAPKKIINNQRHNLIVRQ